MDLEPSDGITVADLISRGRYPHQKWLRQWGTEDERVLHWAMELTSTIEIADRPVEVDDRVQVGHWEGDCIMGSGNRSAIGTLVERATRFLTTA